MARQTRQQAASPRKGVTASAKAKSVTKAPSPARRSGGAKPAAVSAGKPAAVSAGKGPTRSKDGSSSPAPADPPPPPKKPGYYEALAMYENGVRALQRHDYQGAATQFRNIIERYPAERELQERSHLYLRVCERETARRPPTPQTAQERVYAATVALNAGDTATALGHLRGALDDSPDSDHAHYIMSVALAASGQAGDALDHLRRAITLNPENRALAVQDPDLEPVRGMDAFRELLEGAAASPRNRPRKRR